MTDEEKLDDNDDDDILIDERLCLKPKATFRMKLRMTKAVARKLWPWAKDDIDGE